MSPRMLSSCLLVLLSAARGTSALRQFKTALPDGFQHVQPLSPDHYIQLRLSLASRDFAGLESELYAVSTPGNERYGRHLSQAEVQHFILPHPDTLTAFSAFFAAHNFSDHSIPLVVEGSANCWVTLNLTVAHANELFSAGYSNFEHEASGARVVRTLRYALPSELEGVVDLLHPGTTFPQHMPKRAAKNMTARATPPSSCAQNMSPACLQTLYNIPTAPAPASDSRIAVAGFQQQYANAADLQSFLKMFRLDIPANTTFEVQLTAGGQNPQAPNQASLESDLDVQQTIGIATGVSTTFISVGSDGLLDPVGFLNAADVLLNETNPPQVLSVSYGTDELGVDEATARAICNGFAQLGARGVSVIFASGDGGVSGGQTDSSCTSSDAFRPVFPATCPYVTAVGATTSMPETAWPRSSGGFSTLFPAPAYQLASPALAAYLASLNGTYAGRFNASGRAFPDIAAIGDWVPTVWSGQVIENSGTSASAPIFAGVLGLVNAQLLAQGKAAMGWLGPWIWSGGGAAGFNDIVTGSNPGCGTDGFEAREGWDPVTGFGTPNYQKIMTAVGLS